MFRGLEKDKRQRQDQTENGQSITNMIYKMITNPSRYVKKIQHASLFLLFHLAAEQASGLCCLDIYIPLSISFSEE